MNTNYCPFRAVMYHASIILLAICSGVVLAHAHF
ncbi:hypothetical protein pEaSNUABM14_00279 [Erwinia phage pEa_SNUABM_14]|nr:hypothetical protein pEaSNUABM14_00279 [Erwinia phage pEa_SNUABM_14]QYW05632.1 hypothetical protein pEaSNUABM25_00276 [Erwinia phage pEa_SNUABM_25]